MRSVYDLFFSWDIYSSGTRPFKRIAKCRRSIANRCATTQPYMPKPVRFAKDNVLKNAYETTEMGIVKLQRNVDRYEFSNTYLGKKSEFLKNISRF